MTVYNGMAELVTGFNLKFRIFLGPRMKHFRDPVAHSTISLQAHFQLKTNVLTTGLLIVVASMSSNVNVVKGQMTRGRGPSAAQSPLIYCDNMNVDRTSAVFIKH